MHIQVTNRENGAAHSFTSPSTRTSGHCPPDDRADTLLDIAESIRDNGRRTGTAEASGARDRVPGRRFETMARLDVLGWECIAATPGYTDSEDCKVSHVRAPIRKSVRRTSPIHDQQFL